MWPSRVPHGASATLLGRLPCPGHRGGTVARIEPPGPAFGGPDDRLREIRDRPDPHGKAAPGSLPLNPGYKQHTENVRRKIMKGAVSRFLHTTRMLLARALVVAAPLVVAAQAAPAQTYAVTTKPNVEYVTHEGVKLTGDFYLPKGLDKAPVIVAIHGGGWQAGSPDSLNVWAPFMAQNGYAVF